jgi:glycosyltransferase involved in cell wall biosynthesis
MDITRKTKGAWKRGLRQVFRVYGRISNHCGATDGVTIVTVNYNGAECLDALYIAVRYYSPIPVRILVVDNGSTDDSRAWYRAHRDVRVLRFPFNIGHGAAMDIGFYLAQTTIVVAYDIDAFPIDSRWWNEIVVPIREGRARVSGVSIWPLWHPQRPPFVHPCCLAMRRDDFIRRNHSFRENYPTWDTGERISQREADSLHMVPSVSIRGPGPVGMVFGGVIYHNFYGTRFKGNTLETIDVSVDRGSPEAAWSEAVARYIDPIRVASNPS